MTSLRGRTSGLALACAAMGGCYAGLGDREPVADGTAGPGNGNEGSDDDGDDGDDGGDGSDDGTPADPDGCDATDFGAAGMARLTRAEYVRAVRDLLGVAIESTSLPGDESLGPFAANVHNVVSVPALLAYRNVAEDIADVVELAAVVPCDPAQGNDACADDFIATMGRRAYRRPLSDDEAARLRAVFDHGRDDVDFALGIRLAIQAMLTSPNFLYRVELGSPSPDDPEVLVLDGYEVATRLSFLLWGTSPDDDLLEAAGSGELDTAQGRRAQAEAMLDDPRAREGIGHLYAQMFGASAVTDVVGARALYPELDDALARDMEREVAEVASTLVLDEDASLADLLTSRRTMVTPALADLYGVSVPADAIPNDEGLFEAELDAEERSGLLTRAGVMARHSHEDQTAPIHRANFVLGAFGCVEVPDPPPDVDDTPPAVDPDATGRELLEQLTADAACQACHSYLNDVGFAFEHYDAIGRFRTTTGDLEVDASGELKVLDVGGAFEDAVELSDLLAASEDVHACVVDKHVSFAFGRDVLEQDACYIDGLRSAAAITSTEGGSLRDLLLEIVAHDTFGVRKVADAPTTEDE